MDAVRADWTRMVRVTSLLCTGRVMNAAHASRRPWPGQDARRVHDPPTDPGSGWRGGVAQPHRWRLKIHGDKKSRGTASISQIEQVALNLHPRPNFEGLRVSRVGHIRISNLQLHARCKIAKKLCSCHRVSCFSRCFRARRDVLVLWWIADFG